MELQNKTVFFLGSSVTYGSASGGISFAEIMEEECGINAVKEAVSGTTIADIDEGSYVSRLKRAKAENIDLFICQLSTNDAGRNIPIEETEAAIRYIIEFVNEKFACPIVFYTGTRYKSSKYEEMIKLLYSLREEYEFHILDMFYDIEMNSVSAKDYRRYMSDPIHPNLCGYKEWWTPKFVTFCKQI